MNYQRIQYTLSEFSHILLAALLLSSGFVKRIDPIGSAIKIEEYLRAIGLGSLQAMVPALSMALCSFEFFLGGFLLMGLWRGFTAWTTTLFMEVIALVTLYLALFSPVSDCGYFGDALKLTNWQTFGKNVLFMAVMIIYLLTYRRASHPSRNITGSVATALPLLGWGIFVGGDLRHLSLIDFRPYRVNTSLRELTVTPEDTPQKEIEYLFIYERNGPQETFSMEELPDSTWTYMDHQERVIKEGYKPPIMDFTVYTGGGSQRATEREVTRMMLLNGSPQIRVITPSWEAIPIQMGRKLNAFYDWAESVGVAMYGISGSTPEECGRQRNKTATAYLLYFCDGTMIKTMARTQPSAILVSNGVILDKRAARNLPDKYTNQDYEKLSVLLRQAPHAGLHIGRWGLLVVWIIFCLVMLIQSVQWEDGSKYSEYQIKTK